MYIFHLIIIFSILGFLSQIGHDIASGISYAATKFFHIITPFSDTKRTYKKITTGTEKVGVFFSDVVNSFLDPVFQYFGSVEVDITYDITNSVETVLSWVIGIPQGFINYFTNVLSGMGILGFPATMVIIGLGLVMIVALSLFIVKLIQYLVEVL